MTSRREPERTPALSGPTAATDGAGLRLRAAIDRGATGDKINYPDHAAVPLGVDEEAAGTPTSSFSLESEREDRVRSSAQSARPEGYAATPSARGGGLVWWSLAVCVTALLAGMLLVWLNR